MKRQILWAATAGLALAGCTHVECPGIENAQTPETVQSEITVNPFGRKMSRGIVEGAELKEGPASRTFYMSAYNATEGTDYFIGKTFGEKTVTTGDPATPTGTGIWGAVKLNTEAAGDPPTSHWTDDPVYWPFGAKLDFLAYSQSYDETSESARDSRAQSTSAKYPCPKIYANWKSANEVELEVTKESRQDDILYAATSGLNSSNSNSNIGFSMTFKHAQAWLTFMLRRIDSGAGQLIINSVKCANIYSGGRLTLRNEGDGNASADWHFFPLAPSDVTVDPRRPTDLTNPLLLSAGIELNILLPPQEHNGFIINYTLNGIESNLRIPVEQLKSSTGEWKAGWHYTYNIGFTLNEITVAPFVTAWESKTNEWEETHDYVKKMKNGLTYVSTSEDSFSGTIYSAAFTSMFAPPIFDGAHFFLNVTSIPLNHSLVMQCLDVILNFLADNVKIEPKETTVSTISYKGNDWTWDDNGFKNSTITDPMPGGVVNTLGTYIWYMMMYGLHSPDIVLVLDHKQTIELHLSFEGNMLYAMRFGSFNANFGRSGYPYHEDGMQIVVNTTGISTFTIPSSVSAEKFKGVIKDLFLHLYSDNTFGNLSPEKVTYKNVEYTWDEGSQSFKNEDTPIQDALWTVFPSETSMPITVGVTPDIFLFTIIKDTTTP